MLRNLTLSCTMLVSALMAPLAVAQTADFGSEPSAQISYTDLDLTSPNDQAMLGQRVNSVAKTLCKSVTVSTIPFYQRISESQCLKSAVREAEPQIAAAISRANGSPRLAMSGQMIVLRVP